jgi:hypothetical protein
MKAEHRKELETNTLADKMGNVMQRVKTGRRSTFMLYVVAGAILIAGLWFWYVTVVGNRQEASERWLRLDDGGLKNLSELAEKHGETPAGKAARLQLAWLAYWELGVRRMGAEPADAMLKLKIASNTYERLAKDCADDPLFEPQALLGFAVVEETKAVQDTSFLDSATKAYQVVVDKYKESAEGAFAQDRLKQLQDKDSRKEITAIYEDLRKGLDIRGVQVPGPFDQFAPDKQKAPDIKKAPPK